MRTLLKMAILTVIAVLTVHAMEEDHPPLKEDTKNPVEKVVIVLDEEDLEEKGSGPLSSQNIAIHIEEAAEQPTEGAKTEKPLYGKIWNGVSWCLGAAWGKIKGFFKVPPQEDPRIEQELKREMSNRWGAIRNAVLVGGFIVISHFFMPEEIETATYVVLTEQIAEAVGWWIHYNFLPNPLDPALKDAPDPMRVDKMQSFTSILRVGVGWALKPVIDQITNVPIKVVYYTGAGLVTIYTGYKLVKLTLACCSSYKRVRKLLRLPKTPSSILLDEENTTYDTMRKEEKPHPTADIFQNG